MIYFVNYRIAVCDSGQTKVEAAAWLIRQS